MKHSYSAGGVIISKKNKVLVVSQHGTSWSLPKGTLEEGEDSKTAAIREIEEETGITKLNFIKELGTYNRYKIGKYGGESRSHLKTITFFLCSTDQDKLQPIDSDNPEARWVTPDRVAGLLTHPKDKEFYQSVLIEVKKFVNLENKPPAPDG